MSNVIPFPRAKIIRFPQPDDVRVRFALEVEQRLYEVEMQFQEVERIYACVAPLPERFACDAGKDEDACA